MTGFLVMPVRLASIETPDERISFDYFTDPVYGERFWSMALGWNEDEYYPVDIFNIIHDFDMKQFSVFMKTPLDYTSSPILQQSVRNNLKHSVLHRIGIRNKHDVKRARSVYFDYTFNNRRKVSLIASREGIPPLVPDYASAPGMLYLLGALEEVPRKGRGDLIGQAIMIRQLVEVVGGETDRAFHEYFRPPIGLRGPERGGKRIDLPFCRTYIRTA